MLLKGIWKQIWALIQQKFLNKICPCALEVLHLWSNKTLLMWNGAPCSFPCHFSAPTGSVRDFLAECGPGGAPGKGGALVRGVSGNTEALPACLPRSSQCITPAARGVLPFAGHSAPLLEASSWVLTGFPFWLLWVSLMLTPFLGNALLKPPHGRLASGAWAKSPSLTQK